MYKPERTRPITLTRMKIIIIPQMISCALLLMMTTSTMTEMHDKPETKSTQTTLPKSWFREKYLQNSYDEYYYYTLTRYKLEDNDYDVCPPDVHKSSIYFAITGHYMNKIKKTCSTNYLKKTTNIDRYYASPNTTIYHELQEAVVTITNIFGIISIVACYTFELSMLIMSVILASCSTLLLIILLFCQY